MPQVYKTETTKVYSRALDEYIEVNRIIGEIHGQKPGPTVIFTGGIHGNEPSGVFALQRLFKHLEDNSIPVKGNIYGISGNLWALERGERCQQDDLNRLWTRERLLELQNGFVPDNQDAQEQMEIFQQIRRILRENEGPFYFFDLHTTSSKTIPFLTVNDSLLNRKFTRQYPVPIILGIEEYLDGPILSYINELGYVAFGFEGGQHDQLEAIEHHIAFCFLSLVFTDSIAKSSINYKKHFESLSNISDELQDKIFEIDYHYDIENIEEFRMEPGFINFERVKKGQMLAHANGNEINTIKSGRIFMPLYQSSGKDGFFTIKSVPFFFLSLSRVLRRLRIDHLLPYLPGITWKMGSKDTLIVDLKIAKFFAKEFFHLLGYRAAKMDKTHLVIKSREAASKERAYSDAGWY